VYQISCLLIITGTYSLNNAPELLLLQNGSTVVDSYSSAGSGVNAVTLPLSINLYCTVGNTLQIKALSPATSPLIDSALDDAI